MMDGTSFRGSITYFTGRERWEMSMVKIDKELARYMLGNMRIYLVFARRRKKKKTKRGINFSPPVYESYENRKQQCWLTYVHPGARSLFFLPFFLSLLIALDVRLSSKSVALCARACTVPARDETQIKRGYNGSYSRCDPFCVFFFFDDGGVELPIVAR